MKNLILISLLLLTIKSFAQFPNTVYSGSKKQISGFYGAVKADSGIIISNFNDTSLANGQQLKNTAGVLIKVKDTLFLRADCLCKWIKVGTLEKDSIKTMYPLQVYDSAGLTRLRIAYSWQDSAVAVGGGSLPQSGNYLISTGGISLAGNTVSIIAPIVWKYNTETNTRATNFNQVISSATSGKYRKDIIYINSSGNFIYTQGVEDDEVAIAPSVPSDDILLTIIDVFGSTITPPTIASTFQRNGVVYVNPSTGNLTSDSTQFSYNQATTVLQIGGNQPIGTSSSIGLNSNRFVLTGLFNGAILNVGSGSVPGIRDFSKSFSFQNRGNNYLKLSSASNSDHTADFFDTKIKNVPPITTNTDSVAVWEGGVLKKAALTIGGSGWGLTGTSGTNPATNFIGTTDNQPLIFKVNSNQAMNIATNNAISFGNSSATGFNSFAGGFNSTSTGSTSITYGNGNTSNGDFNVNFGTNNTTDGNNSLAIGNFNVSTGAYSNSIGYANSSTRNGSISIGNNLVSNSYGGIVLGNLNNADDNPTNFFASTDRLFQLGNGNYTNNNRSNALTILRNGNLAIGATTTPDSNLVVDRGVQLKGIYFSTNSTDSALVINANGGVGKRALASGGGTTKFTTNGYGTLVDSTSNLYTIRADTTVTAKLRDANLNTLTSNIALKLNSSDSLIYQSKFRSDTSRTNTYNTIALKGNGTITSIATGYGLTGGTITTTGTLIADTAITAKLRDAAINAKLNATAPRVVSLTRSADSSLLVTYATGIVDTFKIYGSGGSGGGGSTDTASISNRINAKQNIAPTTQIITSGTAATINDATNWVIIDPSVALGTLTITLPVNPTAGEIKFNFGGTITGTSTVVTNLVIVANSGQTLVNTGTIGLADAEDSFGIRINSSKWYRQ